MFEIAKRIVDHRTHRFGREAAAPIGRAEPIPKLGRILARIDAAGADQLAVKHHDEAGFAVAPVHGRYELLGVGDAVGMRDASRVRGNTAVVGENRNRLYVLVTRRAQRQPLGLEDGDTALSPGLSEDFFR
jgi:hypothetical protein